MELPEGFERYYAPPEPCDLCGEPLRGESMVYTDGDDSGAEITLCAACIGWGSIRLITATAAD